ncbi:hypothetical protein JCM12856_07650 [Spirochaeta dissipatitropha]
MLQRLEHREYKAGERIINQGDPDDVCVYLIQSGCVELLDESSGRPQQITIIQSGHYFGEWEALFRMPRRLTVAARENCVCSCLSGDDFLWILQESKSFSLALGATLRDKQGIFSAFDRFKTELLRSIDKGHISVAGMLPLYRDLEPALHPHLNDPEMLQTGALNYAVRRLPENLTRTFAFLFTDELPVQYAEPNRYFPSIGSAARRRDIWELLPGKNLVLLRSGLSDLVDMLSCLCLYAVEAEKIRSRLNSSEVFAAIDAHTRNPECDDFEFLETLPFSGAEICGLKEIWPEQTVLRLFDIIRHREMFSIDVRKQTNSWSSRRMDLWTAQIGQAVRESILCDPSEMPEDLRVHIISSNTHSVSNCLNPWYPENRDRVLAWAESVQHSALLEHWDNSNDLLYALLRDYFRSYPEEQEASAARGRDHGIVRLKETASTGIQVQIIDCSRLSGAAIDPDVVPVPSDCRDVIINIDYAFGEQAEHIMRNLVILFGENVRSINFLGKAGALLGKRGDVLAPTAFIEQATDFFQPVPLSSPKALEELGSRMPGREVHIGPMLTVEGTLLQNSMMLHFYRNIWSCIGLEMEGTHYYRQVLESTQTGVIPGDVDLRFFYYISDLPMEHQSALSARMQLSEGVPPLYAITRHILSDIFRSSC